MSKPIGGRIARYLIKGVGAGLAAASIYIAYLYSTVSSIAYPIISALFVMVIAFMIIGSILALLF
ncbi:hypothetical protein HRbin01_01403 [archaeon HR01]|nr:hypothetical protein HRbin01_01403 [archaeon HR01]